MFAYIVYVIVVALAAISATEQTSTIQSELDPPYCAVRYRWLCQGKGRHVACQFPAPGPGESCVNYTLIEFTKELRHFVTHYINRRRQRLATGSERVRGGVHLPRPEVMMQVEWDKELALLAQRLADQCSFVHDDCRATVRFPYAGQTVGEVKWRLTSESDTQNVARAIRRVLDAWWGERRRVTAKQLTQPFRLTNKGNVWGHFSQLAVWTLRAVGCGAVRHGNTYPKILLVCDFSHTNMLGQRTIVPGPLGSCPIHTARKQRSPYPTLCAPVRYEEVERKEQKTDIDDSMDHETSNGDEIIGNYDEDDLDNIFMANASTTFGPNDYTVLNEVNRPCTRKRMRIDPWVETEKPHAIEQESEGNEISQDRNDYAKSKIDDNKPTLEQEEETEQKHEHYLMKKTRGTTIPRGTTDDELFQESDMEEMSLDNEDTGPYQIKKIRNRGKSREKSVSVNEKGFDNYDILLRHRSNELHHDEHKVREKQRTRGPNIEKISEKFIDDSTKAYKIKRIRDREKNHERGRVLEIPERVKTTERNVPPERNILSQNEDIPERQLPFRKEQTPARERFITEEAPEMERPTTRNGPPDRRLFEPLEKDMVPERERPSSREKPSSRERLLEEERHLDRERPLERQRPLERERIPNRDLPPARERQTERPPERERVPNRERLSERERLLERPSGRDKPNTSLERGMTVADVREEADVTDRYKLTTTERERTRYMINIGDIQKKQRHFLDIKNVRKGGNRQKEFRRIQEDPIDKYTIEHVQEAYDEPKATTALDLPKLSNKYRLNNFNDYGTSPSPRYLLDNLKSVSSTAEPRRTQFYEPVGVRHRWRPTKDRPERPGARALVTNGFLFTTTRAPAARKNSVTFASIKMDKEDVEQLFKDTGFNLGWKQYKRILS